MATFYAISSVSKAIVRLFEGGFPRDVLGSVTFLPVIGLELLESWNDTVSILFYRFDINVSGRVAWQGLHRGKKRKPPLPLDLFYIITPWIHNVDRQQRILGWLMQTIHDNPTLPSQYLNADMEKPVFSAGESVDIICEPIKLQDIFTFHDTYKVRFPASMFLTVKQVLIDSEVEIPEGGLVQTRSFTAGQTQ